MSERERVRRAIEEPVESATRLLDEATDADLETRLAMLINGWGRGIAAGLEELAGALEQLRSPGTPEPAEHSEPAPPMQPAPRHESTAEERDGGTTEDEQQLTARAEESRASTAALREEASEELDDAATSPRA